MLYIVAIGWMFVVILMSVVEATASNGSVLGALFTFLLYGVLPLGLVLYLLGAPLRAKQRQAQEDQNQ
jgi:mannose/fructose/N-acetylgalactosamine-specific phosphotransferase system component IID